MGEQRKTRQEGKGSREIPRGLRGDFRRLAERMREFDWTFEDVADGAHVIAFAPRWQEAGISTASLSKTPSDVASFRNARGHYRRWCRENSLEPNI